MKKNSLATHLRLPVGILFCLSCAANGLQAQATYSKQAVISETGGKLRIAANDSRPLAQALEALQQKYGWLINYEDPQYLSKMDIVEHKSQDSGSASRVPGGGIFTVDFAAGATPNTAPDERKTLETIIDAYNRSSNPGRFELRQDGPEQLFEVVGTAARDDKGRLSPQPSPLDLPIALPAEERTSADTVDLICQKLAEKGHVKISLGVHPTGLGRAKVTVGGKELTARAYLFQTIQATGRKLCWRLLFDPDSSSYVLNLHLVKVP
jgi:hypothetical protein